MADVEFKDNTEDIKRLLAGATVKGAEMVGMELERAAKDLCAPRGPNGEFMKHTGPEVRNSITHMVEKTADGITLTIGSNMQIAPYIELGTGKEYDPPPEWVQYNGNDKHSVAGLDQWFYYDEIDKEVKIGKPIPAQPFLRPAVLNNIQAIKNTIRMALEDG